MEEEFLRDLSRFHENNGTPFASLPNINGRSVNLLKLYEIVTNIGGYQTLDNDDWRLVELKMGYKCCPNSSVALKMIYSRFLADYESYPRRKRRVVKHVETGQRYLISPYEKLALSLISPLPNEQDFAINIVSSIPDFIIEDDPRVLYFLLSHAGIYHEPSLASLFDEHYRVNRLHSLDSFWKKDFDMEKTDDSSVLKFFGVEDTGYSFVDDYALRRIIQIVKILLNLTKNNKIFLAQDETSMILIMRCCFSKTPILNKIGWDILSIISFNVPELVYLNIVLNLCLNALRNNFKILDALEVLICLIKSDDFKGTIGTFVGQNLEIFMSLLYKDEEISFLSLEILYYYSLSDHIFDNIEIQHFLNLIKNRETNVLLTCENTDCIDLDKVMPNVKGRYLCEWRGCLRTFTTIRSLRVHASEFHCSVLTCRWYNCGAVFDTQVSLVSHLVQKHCQNEPNTLEDYNSAENVAAENIASISAMILLHFATKSEVVKKKLKLFENYLDEIASKHSDSECAVYLNEILAIVNC